MSASHPKYDICDYHSKLNAYGKGAGIYPKAKAPKPPFHPHCLCRISPRVDLDQPKDTPKTNKSAERAFINSLQKRDAIAIIGSEAKYFNYRMDKDLSVLDIVDKGKPKGYETRLVGDVKPAIMAGMKDFNKFFDGNEAGEYPIYTLSQAELSIFGAKSPVLWLSRISIDEHKDKHPEIGAEHYYKIADIVKNGEIYQQGNKRFALLHVDGVLYRAAIKVTQDAEKIYLLTVFQTTEEKANKEVRRKAELVRSAP